MYIPLEIVQLIVNKCNVKTKFNILIMCKYTQKNLRINTFYNYL